MFVSFGTDIVMTYSEAYYQLAAQLQALYDGQEAAAIAHEALHHITGLNRLERLMRKEDELNGAQAAQYETIKAGLLAARPLQYVLGTAWFMGRAYMVNENVLIPRPETEELVQWIVDEHKDAAISILDIGTGSGCIPISLKLTLPAATVSSCDISESALEVAKQNAARLDAAVNFMHLDFLDVMQQGELGMYDVIVSNPPYIPLSEKETLHDNVKNHEPALALFVADDALLFYKAIAAFGKAHLKKSGVIYCELHRDYAQQTGAMFATAGYAHVEVRKDMHGNERMVKANSLAPLYRPER